MAITLFTSSFKLTNLQTLHFSRSISSAALACSSKLMVVSDSMGPGLQLVGARFLNFLQKSYHESSYFAECRYFTKFKWPHFRAWCYSHMVGHADSATRTVYIRVTLTRSKIKVKVTEHLNFRKLPTSALSPLPFSRGAQN